MTDTGLLHSFIIMQSNGDMRMRDWSQCIEELRSMVAEAINDKDWGQLNVYGPENRDFGLPALCLEAKLTPDAYEALLDAIGDSPWITLPVTICVARDEATRKVGLAS